MAEGPPAEVRGLTKRYGSTVAVDDLSFAIPAGGITGFLGPNGAGNTTTLRALLALLPPKGAPTSPEPARDCPCGLAVSGTAGVTKA